jgi:phospholipid/cholesterol/gamma-HCH transport system substrate-binding protein
MSDGRRLSRRPDPAAVARIARELRRQTRAVVLMVVVAVIGLGVGAYLVVHERIQWPSWMPFVGQHYYILNARVTAVSGVLPGQGQAVTISGVTVGQISGVSLRNGLPVVTMNLDPQYGSRIYPNATVLLRPKTGLQDMVAQLNPGSPSAGPHLKSGATLSAANTLPTVDLDEILAQLDSDTRAFLMELVSNAGQALTNGGGHHLANVLRTFDPLSRDVEKASHLVSLRASELRTLMGNLAKIATTLGDNESALTSFVKGNEGTWHAFAQQNQNLERTIALFPGALQTTDTALAHATTLADTMRAAFTELMPSARALQPTLSDLVPFFRDTTPVLQNQLRPFSVKAQPTAKLLAPATQRLARATPGLKTLAQELDNIMNELAYKPKHGQGYLFYLPWANHDTNSVLSAQDGQGPLRQGELLFSCGTLSLLNNYIHPAKGFARAFNPQLRTLAELLSLPSYKQHCRGILPK